eukprot:m.145774 g.145774  ORF g.145774 m.145774 type:complete len:1287 (-) comp11631_c0_seq3:147-4007(-)
MQMQSTDSTAGADGAGRAVPSLTSGAHDDIDIGDVARYTKTGEHVTVIKIHQSDEDGGPHTYTVRLADGKKKRVERRRLEPLHGSSDDAVNANVNNTARRAEDTSVRTEAPPTVRRTHGEPGPNETAQSAAASSTTRSKKKKDKKRSRNRNASQDGEHATTTPTTNDQVNDGGAGMAPPDAPSPPPPQSTSPAGDTSNTHSNGSDNNSNNNDEEEEDPNPTRRHRRHTKGRKKSKKRSKRAAQKEERAAPTTDNDNDDGTESERDDDGDGSSTAGRRRRKSAAAHKHARRHHAPPPSRGVQLTALRTDKLRLNRKIVQPIVSVMLLDEDTGELLPTVFPDTHAGPNGEHTSEPFSLRDHGTLAPAWNFQTQFAVDYDEVTAPGRNVIAFFTVAEGADMGKDKSRRSTMGHVGNAMRPGLDGAVCWAFMRLKPHYTEKVSRLQLYDFVAKRGGDRASTGSVDRRGTRRSSWWSGRGGVTGTGGGSGERAATMDNKATPAAGVAGLCLAEVALKPGDRKSYPATLYARIDPYALESAHTADGEVMDERRGEVGEGGPVTESLTALLDKRVVVETNWRRHKDEACIVPEHVQETVPLPCGAFTLSFSPDGHYLAVGSCIENTEDGVTLRDHHPITLFHVHDASTFDIDPDHDDVVFAQLAGHQSLVQDLAWSSDARFLVSASSDSTARLWNIAAVGDAREQQSILPHPTFVYCAAFHPSSECGLIFTGAYDGVVRMWDWNDTGRDRTAHLVGELAQHTAHVNSLTFDDSGRKMITADAEGELRIWACAEDDFSVWSPHTVVRDAALQGIPIDSVQLHPSGRRVLVHARDNIVRMLDLRTNLFMQRYHGSYNQRIEVGSCISACGNYVFAGSEDGSVHVWDCDTGKPEHVYNGLGISAPVSGVAFHPCDHIVAFCAFGTGQPLVVLCAEPDAVPTKSTTAMPARAMWHKALKGKLSHLEKPESLAKTARLSMTLGNDTTARASSTSAAGDKFHDLVKTLTASKKDNNSNNNNSATLQAPSMGNKAGGVPQGAATHSTLPYRRAEANEDDIVSELQEERKKQVDELLANTIQRITRRKSILDASSRTTLPIGSGADTGVSPEAVMGENRQSLLSESSFASSEMRALLKREVTQAKSNLRQSDTYWAMFDSQAERPDELHFTMGDKFVAITQQDGDWWKMIHENGNEGWVPASYVRNTPVARVALQDIEQASVASRRRTDARGTMAENDNDAASPQKDAQVRRTKTPKRNSDVGRALRESRMRRQSRSQSARMSTQGPPAAPASAFTEVSGI